MGAPSPFDARQDIVDAEYGAGHYAMGPTAGQVAFDVLFGLLCPVALLLADPALFVPSVADRAALPPYLAKPLTLADASLLGALFLWGVTGMRWRPLAFLLAGPFAAAALLSLALGVALLPFATTHSDLLSGLLAFTPWLTAFVFVRHCVIACRVAASRSLLLTVLVLPATCIAIVLLLFGTAVSTDRKARLIEALLFSDDAADYQEGLSRIRHVSDVDMDRVALQYLDLKEGDPRRRRIEEVHLRLTGVPVDAALARLLPSTAAPDRGAPTKAPKTQEDLVQGLLDRFFSAERDEHLKAADELVTHNPDPKVLERIAQHYAELPEGDPRREWVEAAYTSLNSEGETIQQAMKRIGKQPRPDEPPKPPPHKRPAPSRPPDAPRPPQPTP